MATVTFKVVGPTCPDTRMGYDLIRWSPDSWNQLECYYGAGGTTWTAGQWTYKTVTFESGGGGMTEAQLNSLLAKLDEVKAAQVATTSQVSTSGAAGVSAVEAAVVAGIDQSAYVQVLVVVVLYVLGLFFGWRVTGRAENRSG